MLCGLPLRNTLQYELEIYFDTRRPIWELDFINVLIVGNATSTSISRMTSITSQATLVAAPKESLVYL